MFRKLVPFVLVAFFVVVFPMLAFAQDAGPASATTGDLSVGSGHPYRDVTLAPAPTGAPDIAVQPEILDELDALRKQYAELKSAKDGDAKMLLWAALIAGVLKTLLSITNVIWKKPKKWLAWVAMGTAVPIALLSHFAAGNGWVDSLIVAGGGPGAILFNELLKLFAKSKAEPEPAKA
jgi:hypothetical protein